MHMSGDASERFRRFMFAAWTTTDYSQRELMARAGIRSERRNTFARAFHFVGPQLDLSEARRAIDAVVAHPLVQVEAEMVWDWIMGRIPTPEKICELIISSALHPRRLRGHTEILARVEANAREQISFSIVPKISALPEEIVRTVHRNCTSLLGAQASRVLSALNQFYQIRRNSRVQGNQRPAKQTLLHFRSDLVTFREGKGLLAGLTVEQTAQGFEDFADDVIDVHGHEIGIIDDRSSDVPRDLINHFRRSEAVFICDTDYLMKVHLGGLFRTTCFGQDDISRAYIQGQAAKLHQLKACVRHGWRKNEMKDALMRILYE